MSDGVTAHARAHAQKRFKVRDSPISAGNAVMTYYGSLINSNFIVGAMHPYEISSLTSKQYIKNSFFDF